MSVIDLATEREARAPLQSEVLQISINTLDAQIAKLIGNDDAESALTLSKLLKEKSTNLNKLVLAQKREEREAFKAAQAAIPTAAVDEELKADIRTFLKEADYFYTHSDATYWLYTPGARSPWTSHSRSTLVNHDPRLDSRSPFMDLFTEVLKEDNRWFRDHATTFAKVPAHTLNKLRWNFLKPTPAPEGESHSWVFDTLIYSLAGGKTENMEHIEKVLVAKYLNPANYSLPTIVISDGGGTGKSLFAEKLLPVIFGKDLVAPNVSMDEMTGQFNSHLHGKAVWFINENRADGNDTDAIKRVLGSATLRTERKGKDATQTDNIALVFVAGNFSLGAIKLTGTEVDRRFSILNATRPLKSYVAEVNTAIGNPMSEAEAAEWMWNEGQHIISDPTEVAKWLHHLIEKHKGATTVLALHGEDYRHLLDAQASTNEQVYRAFFTSDAWIKDGYFKQAMMFRFYGDYMKRNGNRMAMSNQRFYAEAEAWLERKGIPYERVPVIRYDGSTASIFWNPTHGHRPGSVPSNDRQFGAMDDKKNITWIVDID